MYVCMWPHTCNEKCLAYTIIGSHDIVFLEVAEGKDGHPSKYSHVKAKSVLCTEDGGVEPTTASEGDQTCNHL